MASFKVRHHFTVTKTMAVTKLVPGANYIAGDVITGVMAAEAVELLINAPQGTFEPLDAEARTVVAWYERKITQGEIVPVQQLLEDQNDIRQVQVGGLLGASGDLNTAKE